jgi:hypothetical protein
MTIRWRLLILAIQLAILGTATYVVTGKPYSAETWYLAGLFAVVINPQLLEPYYPRPGDVVGNSFIFLFIFLTTNKTVTTKGWYILAVIVGLFFSLGLIALLAGAGKKEGRFIGLARAARSVSQLASSRIIYSSVFFLSILEYDHSFSQHFWTLTLAWVGIIAIGKVNWQAVILTAVGQVTAANAEGMIGPSSILISAPEIPAPGTRVDISSANVVSGGVVISRIRRPEDVWGQIHIDDNQLCERILKRRTILVEASSENDSKGSVVVGAVDAGSTDQILRFTATKPLEVGQVVAVPGSGTVDQITYQLSSAHIERLDVKGGSHLVVGVKANQLGIFDSETCWFRSHRWVPSPGAPVHKSSDKAITSESRYPSHFLLLGQVIGTTIPVFLDINTASEGHLAILGMTKMGKTTLAERIARHLAQSRRVTILDQTGEYVNKKGFPPCDKEVDWTKPGISIFEPKTGEVPAKRAYDFLKFQVDQAVKEYKVGDPLARTVIIDEAHQFIPEPAGLGFNAPGRDQSYAIGLLMMQIRKFGISVILISQRTAVVAKSALSQCENLIAFRSVDQTGLDYLEAVAGGDIRNFLPQLRQGEAVVFGPGISSDTPVGIEVSKEPQT